MKFQILGILILKLLLMCHDAVGFEAEAANDNVSFDKTTILINEEMEPPVELLKFSGVKGELKFTVTTPNKNLIKLTYVNNILTLGTQLDYENVEMRKFLIQFEDDETKDVNYVLNPNNINDNKPVLVNEGCSMQENTTDIEKTTCIYKISDLDGHLDTISFAVNKPYDDLFLLDYQNKPDMYSQNSEVSLTLKDEQILDFEKQTIYIFTVDMTDNWDNMEQNANASLLINVIDIPDTPPIFQTTIGTKTFDEESLQTINVIAIDGDISINAKIDYEISSIDDKIEDKVTVDKNGEITIQPIDRDELGGRFTFTITAFEVDDESSQTSQDIVLVVNDIDDNCPIITAENESTYRNRNKLSIQNLGADIHEICKYEPKETIITTIPENFVSTIPISISVSDKDEGDNSYYNMVLEDFSGKGYDEAFSLIPPVGYGRNVTVVIQVRQPTKLDYEDESWRKITFDVVAKEKIDETKQDRRSIEINLTNVNDNPPVFVSGLACAVDETVGKDTLITTVKATDADGDTVSYDLVGTDFLKINKETGEIRTSKDNAFDYERQVEVSVQVVAKDEDEVHSTFGLLKITINDINDEQPRISVDSRPITRKENEPGIFDNETITATDQDAQSKLEFSIDWSNTYATKNSMKKEGVIEGAIKIESVTDTDKKVTTAILSFVDIDPGNTPDFEKYDSIFLTVVVTDTNQTIGINTDSARVTIGIINVNDNKPQFTNNTITTPSVLEHSTGLISTVTATDEDIDDIVKYRIKTDEKETENWVTINEDTGEISANDGIDADEPVDKGGRANFTCTVTASDGDPSHDTDLKITIIILDTNNKPPVPKNPTIEKTIKENAENGTKVTVILATDDDRDEKFHTLNYQIDRQNSEILHLFRVEPNGEGGCELIVSFDKPDEFYFDREEKEIYSFEININDNNDNPVGEQKTAKVKVTITLEDVNNKDPTITTLNITSVENVEQGKVVASLEGEDRDGKEENNVFSVEITKIVDTKNTANKDLPEFEIKDKIKGKGTVDIIAKKSLRGYYGEYELEVYTLDTGTDPGPRDKNQTVILDITPFNFEQPSFKFPEADKPAILLRKEDQGISARLYDFNDVPLNHFEVEDNQADKWKYIFTLTNAGESNLFGFKDFSKKQNDLVMMNTCDEDCMGKEYNITYSAKIEGEKQNSQEADYNTVERTIKVKFIDTTKPFFNDDTYDVSVDENTNFTFQPPNATYANEIDPDDVKIYYRLELDDETEKYFTYNEITREITIKMLDYEERHNYDLKFSASSNTNFNDMATATLTIKIEVNDVNDELPSFDRDTYVGCILTTYETGRKILALNAIDLDHWPLTYTIDEGTMQAHGSNIEKIAESEPFGLNDNNLTLQFSVESSMSGYFTFSVTVTDQPEPFHTDQAGVKVFIVTDVNIVKFKFQNALVKVDESKEDIVQILKEVLNYDNYIESTQAMNTDEDVYSEVRIYFLDDVELLESEKILDKVGDISIYKDLKSKFWAKELNLQNFDSTSEDNSDLASTLKAWLIGISVGLSVLIVALIAMIIFKTRQLNQRITNLTTTKFGSQESNLNRIGASAPTTNKHAVEGSNPVYMNDESEDNEYIDRRSIASGDSELYGLEDNPEFETKDTIERF